MKKMTLMKKLVKRKVIAIDIISHDILNQVTSIKNYIQLLKEFKLEENVKKILRRIDKYVDRIVEILHNSIRLAKLYSIDEFQKVEMNLYELVSSAIYSLETKARKKNIKIKNLIDRNLLVNVNPIFINVIENLLDNAIKYSYENSHVIIEAEELNGKVRIKVKDYGVGIPDEYKKKIFERFERYSKEGIKGTGLGLAIVKRIVELHNGEVWVEDNKPRGSIFVVEIPKK